MTTFLLVRHAEFDLVGKTLCGRTAGISLNARGRTQAERLAVRLSRFPLKAILCSPLDRACETARPLADMAGLDVRASEGLNEIAFGDWTGLSFEVLRSIPGWNDFNQCRSCNRAPGGESLIEVQSRAVAEINRAAAEFPDGIIAVISHGDVIRAAIAYYLGIPLDLLARFEVSPASVSILKVQSCGPLLLALNITEEMPHDLQQI